MITVIHNTVLSAGSSVHTCGLHEYDRYFNIYNQFLADCLRHSGNITIFRVLIIPSLSIRLHSLHIYIYSTIFQELGNVYPHKKILWHA